MLLCDEGERVDTGRGGGELLSNKLNSPPADVTKPDESNKGGAYAN